MDQGVAPRTGRRLQGQVFAPRSRGLARRHAAKPWLVIMVKQPRMGRAKTRLAREVGAVEALRFYRASCRAVGLRLSHDPRWRTVLAVTPDTVDQDPAWIAGLGRLAQGGGGLGHRMQRVFQSLPPGPAVIVGTDIPSLRPTDIAAVLAGALRSGAAFGPAPDGGYWAVGVRRSPRIVRPFGAVRWSTEFALADTIDGFANDIVPEIGPVHADVDDAQTFDEVRAWAGRVVLPFDVGHQRTA